MKSIFWRRKGPICGYHGVNIQKRMMLLWVGKSLGDGIHAVHFGV